MPQLSVILVGAPAPTLTFPGADLVGAAAALFQKGPRSGWVEGYFPDGGRVVHEEDRSFSLSVSPGTVGVAMREPKRSEVTAAAARITAARQAPAMHWPTDDDPLGLRLLLDDDGSPARFDPVPARQVEGWSRRSRARATRRWAQLDYSPMFDTCRAAVMLTLTYPGDWLTVAPDGRAVKRHLTAFRKRYRRAWGVEPVVLWKLEFQRRGAPHLHLLLVPPVGAAVCCCREHADAAPCTLDGCTTRGGHEHLLFRSWASHAWADVLAHPDPEQRRRGLLAGTGVDYARGGRAFDPKRTAVYFAKHGGAAGGKEYQHQVPVEWQGEGRGPGRFWGYWGLAPAVAEVTVTTREYVVLRRTLRRWSESKRLTRTRRVERVDTRTGTVRTRTVTRPLRYVGHGGMAGGTVLVNDGPAFASALARLFSPSARTQPTPTREVVP